MILIFILLLCLHLTIKNDLLSSEADFIFSAQNWCVSLISDRSSSKVLMDSFLCGTNVQDIFLKELFLQSGLIHLLVVSGGHFAFLVATFEFFSFGHKKWWLEMLKIPIFIGFSFMTGFQAPVVRALASICLRSLNSYFRWSWEPGKIQLCSGLFILVLFPDWILSLSFYLSWLASIGLCFHPLWRDQRMLMKKSWWQKIGIWISLCLIIQCLLSLFFWQFSWTSLSMNLLVAPLLMWALWPLGLMLVLIPFSYPLVDLAWHYILQMLETSLYVLQESGFQNSGTEINFSQLQWAYLWSLIILFHSILELLGRWRYRGHHV